MRTIPAELCCRVIELTVSTDGSGRRLSAARIAQSIGISTSDARKIEREALFRACQLLPLSALVARPDGA